MSNLGDVAFIAEWCQIYIFISSQNFQSKLLFAQFLTILIKNIVFDRTTFVHKKRIYMPPSVLSCYGDGMLNELHIYIYIYIYIYTYI